MTTSWTSRTVPSTSYGSREDVNFLMTQALDFLMTQDSKYIVLQDSYTLSTDWTARTEI